MSQYYNKELEESERLKSKVDKGICIVLKNLCIWLITVDKELDESELLAVDNSMTSWLHHFVSA